MNRSLPFSSIQGNAFNGIRKIFFSLVVSDQADVSIFPLRRLSKCYWQLNAIFKGRENIQSTLAEVLSNIC